MTPEIQRRTFFGTVVAGLASLVGIKGAAAVAVSEKTREVGYAYWDDEHKAYAVAYPSYKITPNIRALMVATVGHVHVDEYACTNAAITYHTDGRMELTLGCRPKVKATSNRA